MAKFIDLDTGLPALLNKVKAWVNSKLSAKQDTLTFDDAPTAGSNNAVKSGGIKTALDNLLANLHIVNGEWYIGNTATGVSAQGPAGNVNISDASQLVTILVNDLTTGGAGNILSAAMGVVLKNNIELLLQSIGEYAFPNGRPTLSWQGAMRTITQALTHVTSDCALASIADGSSLTIQLTVDTNCTLDSVIVTMGGVDITATAYDAGTGVITIASVTGDVVINATATLLYDAEIEYLESTGTQWIDTGIVAGAGFKCEIKADVQAADTAWHRLLAARDADGKFAIAVGLRPTNERGCLYAQFGTSVAACITFNLQQVTGLHTIITELTGTALSIKVDGVDGSEIDRTSSLSFPDLSLYMFSNHRQDSTIESISAKAYYCKIWNGGNLVFDAIPVRVGQVGYMYDRVSGELLGNIGTGSFTLGNDLSA